MLYCSRILRERPAGREDFYENNRKRARLVFGGADARPLPYQGHPAALLLQKSAARRLHDCDLAFEYSDVRADIRGGIDSIKNPRRGVIRADSVGEIIRTEDSVYPSRARILLNNAGK